MSRFNVWEPEADVDVVVWWDADGVLMYQPKGLKPAAVPNAWWLPDTNRPRAWASLKMQAYEVAYRLGASVVAWSEAEEETLP